MSEDSKRIIGLLEELVKWRRLEGTQLARKTLKEILSKDTEKLVYQYSTGRTSKEIAALAGVSDFSVRNYWKRWNLKGLVMPSQKFKGRYERMFSLEDFGIEVPPTKKSIKSETRGNSDTEVSNNE